MIVQLAMVWAAEGKIKKRKRLFEWDSSSVTSSSHHHHHHHSSTTFNRIYHIFYVFNQGRMKKEMVIRTNCCYLNLFIYDFFVLAGCSLIFPMLIASKYQKKNVFSTNFNPLALGRAKHSRVKEMERKKETFNLNP